MLVRAGTAQTLLQLCTMSGLYPVREASEEDMHFSTDDVDVLDLLQDTSGIITASALFERSLCCFKNPVYVFSVSELFVTAVCNADFATHAGCRLFWWST